MSFSHYVRLPDRWVRAARVGVGWLSRAGLDLVFPPQCLLCDVELPPDHDETPLCEKCRQLLGPEEWNGCRGCGSLATAQGQPAEKCPACQGTTLHFDHVVPLGPYDGQLREAVLRMKRLAHEPLSVGLAGLMLHRRGKELSELKPDVVMPVPMYWWRRLRRGTNSPEILAECLGRRLGVKVRHGIIRRRNTLPQKDLMPNERRQNVRGAFRLSRWDSTRWKDAHVLLVDDILTTGATCSEVARVLKQGGVRLVSVAVLAKAQGPRQ